MSELWTSWVHAGSGQVQPTLFTLAFSTTTGMADHVYTLFCAASRPGKWHIWKRLSGVPWPTLKFKSQLKWMYFLFVSGKRAWTSTLLSIWQSSAVKILSVLFWKIRLRWNWRSIHSLVIIDMCLCLNATKQKNIPYETAQPHKDFAIIQNHFAFAECKTAPCPACLVFSKCRKTFQLKHLHSLQSSMFNEQLLRGVLEKDPTGKGDKLSLICFFFKLHSQLKEARKWWK